MIDHLVETDFKAVDKREGVAAASGYLLGDTKRVPLITDDERPWGVINERSLMKTRVNPSDRVEHYTLGTGALTPDVTIEEAVRRFGAAAVEHFPVENRGRLVGYVTAARLLQEVEPGLPAHRLMDEVPIVRENQTAGDALHLFHDVKVGALPVVDGNGRVTGVLSRRNLIPLGLTRDYQSGGRTYAGGERLHMTNLDVKGLADNAYGKVKPDSSYEEVLEKLEQFGSAVVVDEAERPVGIITAAGALKRVAPEVT